MKQPQNNLIKITIHRTLQSQFVRSFRQLIRIKSLTESQQRSKKKKKTIRNPKLICLCFVFLNAYEIRWTSYFCLRWLYAIYTRNNGFHNENNNPIHKYLYRDVIEHRAHCVLLTHQPVVSSQSLVNQRKKNTTTRFYAVKYAIQ